MWTSALYKPWDALQAKMAKWPEKWSDYDAVGLKSTHKPHGGLAATLRLWFDWLRTKKKNTHTSHQTATASDFRISLGRVDFPKPLN